MIFSKDYESEYDQEIPQSHTADQPMTPNSFVFAISVDPDEMLEN